MSRTLLPARLLGVAVFLLPMAGCFEDPQATAARAYSEAMGPVLTDNMALTRQFVAVATEVKKGEADPRAIGERFESKLVPAAALLRDAAIAVVPEDETLAATHGQLTVAWTQRVEVYAEIHRSWAEADLDAFDAAMRRNLELKAAEERYFTEANSWLGQHDVALDQFP